MRVWHLSDGKHGHDSHVNGLLQGLTDIGVAVELQVFSCSKAWPLLQAIQSVSSNPPDLIVGCGHATHKYLLILKLCFRRSRQLVILKPSLPLAWFDLQLLPAHDGLAALPNRYVYQGVLAPIVNRQQHRADSHAILVGGVSSRYHWDTNLINQYMQRILTAFADSTVQFSVTASRRTPDSFWDLKALAHPQILTHHLHDTQQHKGWVNQQLNCADVAWVSEDSVSMICESLKAGCKVVIIPMRARRHDRVTRFIAELIAKGVVFSADAVIHDPSMLRSAPVHSDLRAPQEAKAATWLMAHLQPVN